MKAQTILLSGRRKKKLERQVEKYLSTLQDNRNDYKTHTELGETYALLEEIEKSIKHYYTAIDLLRKSPSLGKTKNQIIELYEKIINIAPNDPRAYMELSEEYIAEGQKEKAFRFLLSSAKKAYENENHELALRCYEQTIAKGRTNPHIVERCTELYLKLGRKEEAMRNYVHIGDMYAQEEKNIEALEYYKKACALDKDNPELVLKVARMYNAMAWTENAASELVKVGEYYETRKDFTEALRYYRYSVRLDPENEKAQEGKRRITESYTVDGIPLTDLESQEGEEQDVLVELDRIEESMGTSLDQTVQGEFEVTPIDLNATLTFEGPGTEGIDFDQATQLEPEIDLNATLTFKGSGTEGIDFDQATQPEPEIDLNATLTFEGLRTEEVDFDQAAQSEPEIIPMDRDIGLTLENDEILEEDFSQLAQPEAEVIPMDRDTILALEGNEISEEVSPIGQESSSASSISLEDWIIDLKEDELVELALEEALAEQDKEEAEAGSGMILSIEEDYSESADQRTSGPFLPAISEQTEGEEVILHEEQPEPIPVEFELEETLSVDLEKDQNESAEQETSPFLQVAPEQIEGEEVTLPEEQESPPAEPELEETLRVYLEEDQDESAEQETSPFLQVAPEQAEDDEMAILPEQEFPDESNLEEPELSPSTSPSTSLKTGLGIEPVEESKTKGIEVVGEEEQVAEFTEDVTTIDELLSRDQPEEEQLVESSEDTTEVDEQASQDQLEEELVSFIEDTTEVVEHSDQAQPEEEFIKFMEDVAGVTEHPDQAQLEEELITFTEDVAEVEAKFSQVQLHDNIVELRHRIEDLEQQLQRTEEEKYFLQEKFAAQVSRHKAHEESLQREITDVYKDKEDLEKQLQQIAMIPRTGRKGSGKFDEARYEALVTRIQNRKALLQQHLHKLLKKREKNGHFLAQELNTLNITKQRLQSNLEYFQQIKARVEEKINTELRQARLEIQSLTKTSQYLETKLQTQQQVERNLRSQFETLSKEKEALQENYTKSISILTKEKADLERQLQEMSKLRKVAERNLKKKLQGLYRSYQQLKVEYKTALDVKEGQINESAQQLSEFADKYVKLEKALANIRRERDKLNKMLAQETETREILEEKLVSIEFQVDSLEIQGVKLLKQLGQELDHHFDMEQNISDKFQLSLEELENLLLLQEKEIQNLEAL